LAQEVVEPGIAGLVEAEFGASVEEVFGAPLLPGGVSYRGNERIVETQIAAFGEASLRIASRLHAIGGIRVSRSKLDLLVASAGPYAGPNAATNSIRERRTETPITPRLAVNYRLGRDTLLYASASRGYRAGGANTPVPVEPCAADLIALGRAAAPTSFGSDALWNYDAGIKAAIPRAHSTVAASVFQIDWRRVQQSIALPNCGFSYVDNLGAARSRGFEFEAQLRPLPQLQLFAGIGHVDARFRRTLRSGAGLDGQGAALLVKRGDRVPFTPGWSINAAGEYDIDLGAVGRGFVRADYRYLGAYKRTPASPAISFDETVFAGESRSTLDLRAGIAKDGWRVTAFAQNVLSDEAIVFSSAELVPATKSPLRQATVMPRRVGVNVELHY
jgi:outer membrane receptor protein involved in Fe transport